MKLLKAITFIRKKLKLNRREKLNDIFYKIVDGGFSESYKIQCINTSAVFSAKLTDIILDLGILTKLHPAQACYLGLEYTQHHEQTDFLATVPTDPFYKAEKRRNHQDALYRLYYQDRQGNLVFWNEQTNEQLIMDPREIASSPELIKKFQAFQAFYIGLLAGFKIQHISRKSTDKYHSTPPCLRVVR